MFVIVWEFRVRTGCEAEFELHYRHDGTWAQLFRLDPAYQGTTLLRDPVVPGRYLTLDHWENSQSYDSFRQSFAQAYAEIDASMEHMTESETKLGVFEPA
ncbi:MAG TPA: antibiotic biosynthesis monooxygenase [Terriglobales bacterium]|nr:antibiotic biosynthesis monooxygenase [Terriglobales bacterium]